MTLIENRIGGMGNVGGVGWDCGEVGAGWGCGAKGKSESRLGRYGHLNL